MKKFLIGLLLIPAGFIAWGSLTFFVVIWGFWHAPALHDFWIDSPVPMIICMAAGPLVCWVILPLAKYRIGGRYDIN
jgi:hypothetical protein